MATTDANPAKQSRFTVVGMGCGGSHDAARDEKPSVPLPPFLGASMSECRCEGMADAAATPTASGSGPAGSTADVGSPDTQQLTSHTSSGEAKGGRRGNLLQHLVSKKKTRFMKDGFDLDLAYITPQLIAMGYPSTGAESWYRNPAAQVSRAARHRRPCSRRTVCPESG